MAKRLRQQAVRSEVSLGRAQGGTKKHRRGYSWERTELSGVELE